MGLILLITSYTNLPARLANIIVEYGELNSIIQKVERTKSECFILFCNCLFRQRNKLTLRFQKALQEQNFLSAYNLLKQGASCSLSKEQILLLAKDHKLDSLCFLIAKISFKREERCLDDSEWVIIRGQEDKDYIRLKYLHF